MNQVTGASGPAWFYAASPLQVPVTLTAKNPGWTHPLLDRSFAQRDGNIK
jgi:hypothetical protein